MRIRCITSSLFISLLGVSLVCNYVEGAPRNEKIATGKKHKKTQKRSVRVLKKRPAIVKPSLPMDTVEEKFIIQEPEIVTMEKPLHVEAQSQIPVHPSGVYHMETERPDNTSDKFIMIDDKSHSANKDIIVEIGSGKLIEFPEDIGHIFISDPSVSDVNIMSKNSFELLGLKQGKTRLRVDNKDGKAIFRRNISVTFDLERISAVLKEIFPNSQVTIVNLDTAIVLTGTVESPKTASDIMDTLAKMTNGEANIVNNMTVGTPTQVMLKVKIAKVYREVTKSLGINWKSLSLGSGFNAAVVGGPSGGVVPLILGTVSAKAAELAGIEANTTTSSTAATGSNDGGGDAVGTEGNTGGAASAISSAMQANAFDHHAGLKGDKDSPPAVPTSKGGARWVLDYHDKKGNNIGGIIDALAEESLATILAEPTLVALSGETAKFTSGGEEPYKNGTTGNAGTTTTQFKEWGIMLDFSPTVLSSDRIRMKVKPEVSSIETSSSSADGEKPLSKQSVETTVELGSGQSLAIAGLIKKEKSIAASELPGMSSLPLVGGLFRSSNNTLKETELVIIVTPYIVKPSSKQLMTPVDNMPKIFSPCASNIFKKFYHVSQPDDEKAIQKAAEHSGFTVS